ncbi:signal peptidase II, partial [Bordetella bronchiseptica]|uniref:signal peptidase II n=1 Tax=Bordetella bronchiseptica TaxID=518 RepID=UPI0004A0FF8E
FSFLASEEGWQRWFFTALGVGASIVIVWLLRRTAGQPRFSLALTLIMGGALGNVIDRVAYGHVVDFLLFYWRDWQDIAARIELAVATRPGASIAPPAELATWLAAHRRQLHELPFAPMAVSASDIRQRLAAGAATDGLLPEPVAAYIATHHLYR